MGREKWINNYAITAPNKLSSMAGRTTIWTLFISISCNFTWWIVVHEGIKIDC